MTVLPYDKVAPKARYPLTWGAAADWYGIGPSALHFIVMYGWLNRY